MGIVCICAFILRILSTTESRATFLSIKYIKALRWHRYAVRSNGSSVVQSLFIIVPITCE